MNLEKEIQILAKKFDKLENSILRIQEIIEVKLELFSRDYNKCIDKAEKSSDEIIRLKEKINMNKERSNAFPKYAIPVFNFMIVIVLGMMTYFK